MIKAFRINNLATIEEIELDLKEGFSIFTGETGVGKSIIIDGLRLVLGEKGSSDLIRTGEKETSIEAIFRSPPGHLNLEAFPSDKETELLIQRRIYERGTGKGYINGVLVPIKKIREFRNELIDIYGQNDHVFLRNAENQLEYLDCYAEAVPLRSQLAAAAHTLRKLLREKNKLETEEKEREQRLDFLNYQINEIEKAALQPKEEEDLRQERNLLKNAEKISLLLEEAIQLAYDQENSVYPLLSRLQNIVSKLSEFDTSFLATKEAIDQFVITIDDFSGFLHQFKEQKTASPERLEKIEERLSEIEKLKRKYGPSIPEILDYLKKVKKDYQELSTSHEKLAGLGQDIDNTFRQYQALAKQLSQKRKTSARTLEDQVKKEISVLGMNKARFKIDFQTIPVDSTDKERIRDIGMEEVEFLISPNPGEKLRPLRKIASGGELSRFMLALKSIGKETDKLKTLIFDEIDSGIGGKTAEFVAQKLRDLSQQHQVICITHLPQIASFATHHYKIDKKIKKNRTYTIVKKLPFEERIQEIARLLTGSRITETSLKNAKEMLKHNLNLNS